MKAVIQRCRSASVSVGGDKISEISRGLLVLVGIATEDTPSDLSWLCSKLLNLRLFPEDVEGDWGWKKSVVDVEGDILCVSQFTLLARTKKGTKPDFHGAMGATQSQQMYENFLQELRLKYNVNRIKDGKFGAMMDVSLTNDGPATIILDSRDAPAPLPIKAAPLSKPKKVAQVIATEMKAS